MKQVKDMDNNQYTLIQQDTERKEILQYVGVKADFSYLFVKLDSSGADYQEIYGSDSPNLDAYVFKIYTNKFNQKLIEQECNHEYESIDRIDTETDFKGMKDLVLYECIHCKKTFEEWTYRN